MKNGKYYIGIDIGGTNIKIGCVNTDFKIACKVSVLTTPETGPKLVVQKIGHSVQQMLIEAGLTMADVAAAGLGVPGPSDFENGIVEFSPNLPLFKNTPLKKMVSEELGVPVVYENDANAACWGEFVAGSGRGVSDMVFFTLGTGIGGGIICNGKLVHGFGGNAAELGHIIIYPGGRLCGCGQRGCVEAYASATSTVRRALELLELEENTESPLADLLYAKSHITCEDIFDKAAEGDRLAAGLTDITAESLAIVCVNMLHTTAPQRIVFGGGMTNAGEGLLNRIKYFFNDYIWPMKKENLEICFASLGDDAGIIGAAALAVGR